MLLQFLLLAVSGTQSQEGFRQCRNDTRRWLSSAQNTSSPFKVEFFEQCNSEKKYCFLRSAAEILQVFNGLEDSNGSTLCSVDCWSEKIRAGPFTSIFLVTVAFFVTLSIIATLLDYIEPKKSEKPHIKALLIFSIYTNGSQILDMVPSREGHLKCLDFIRFVSMVWIGAGHMLDHIVSAEDQLYLTSNSINALKSFPIAVDSFLVLSGLLVVYTFFKNVSKNPKTVKSPSSWALFYLHRYLRLTPPYMIFLGFILAVIPFLTGPITFQKDLDSSLLEPCHQYWWRNLFYLNNLFTADQCYRISWYLALDMQCFIVTPLFLLAFYQSAWLGYALVVVACVASSVYTTFLIFIFNLPGSNVRATIEKVDEFDVWLYFNPLVRSPVYFIGMAAGYFLAMKGTQKYKIHWAIPSVGWVFAIVTGWLILSGAADYNVFQSEWPPAMSACYYVGSRVGWALLTVWVILSTHYGFGGPLGVMIEHPLWQPFGRLNYCVYLTHKLFVHLLWDLQDTTPRFTGIFALFMQQVIPILTITYIFSFFWSSIFEIPFIKLDKLLFSYLLTRRKESTVQPVAYKF